MFLIIIAIVIILCAVCHIMNFPGGPSGFAICTKMWIKRKVTTLRSYLSKGFNQPILR